MNLPELEQLVQIVQGANISELTLRHNGARVTIRKKAPPTMTPQSRELTLTHEGELVGDDFHLDMETDPQMGEEADAEENIVAVRSPLVGTFRHAKQPVVLGAIVQAGQVLGIIEAMKLPNEVPAPMSGKVVEVLVEEGQFVEYGQELYVLLPE